MRKPFFALAVLALVASGAFASMARVNAADHRDSPSNVADAAADGTDLYVFKSPANTSNVVIAFDFNPLIAPSDNATRLIDPNVTYAIKIDRTGDAIPERMISIRYAGQNQFVIDGLGASMTVPITPPGQAAIVTKVGDVSAFAGLRDDPFFFDLSAFQAFVAKPTAPAAGLRPAGGGSPTDTFAGTNIDSIVLEMPVAMLTGGTNATSGKVNLVATTTRGGKQVDRVAFPAVNTALIPAAKKDAFNNATDEAQDAASFKTDVVASINGLRAAVDPLFGGASTESGGPLGNLTADQVAAAVLPDVTSVDFSAPVQFPNGRRLQDDVIDTVLGVVLNRGGSSGISDGVNANDKPFLSTFPYLAEPWTTGGAPATAAAAASGGVTVPPGQGTAGVTLRPPNTGDAGLTHDSGVMWTLSATLFVVAVAFGGAGAFVAIRNRSR